MRSKHTQHTHTTQWTNPILVTHVTGSAYSWLWTESVLRVTTMTKWMLSNYSSIGTGKRGNTSHTAGNRTRDLCTLYSRVSATRLLIPVVTIRPLSSYVRANFPLFPAPLWSYNLITSFSHAVSAAQESIPTSLPYLVSSHPEWD